LPTDESDLGSLKAKRFAQQGNYGFVRPTVLWRGGDAHLERAGLFPEYRVPLRFRLYAKGERRSFRVRRDCDRHR